MSKPKRPHANPGDVFAVRQKDGRYGAVRALRTIDKSTLIYTSQYLEPILPSLDDPLLRLVQHQNRFFYKNAPAIVWIRGHPPANIAFLGNIPLTNSEIGIECNSFGGNWAEKCGNEAFLEWRWLYDRPAFEAEVEKQEKEFARRRRLPQKPKMMMEVEAFWRVIRLFDWRQQGNDEKVLEPAVIALSKLPVCQIKMFAERLAFLLYQIDTKAHAKCIGKYAYDEKKDYVSSDGFLYARCAVVANGQRFYEAAINDPEKMPKDIEFEALLYLAPRAYERKTGNEYDFLTGCDFESFSNSEGWK